jgi:hypothetical protein
MFVRDCGGLQSALIGVGDNIRVGKKGTSPEERRRNIDIVKGLMISWFEKNKDARKDVYGDHSVVDIEAMIR